MFGISIQKVSKLGEAGGACLSLICMLAVLTLVPRPALFQFARSPAIVVQLQCKCHGGYFLGDSDIRLNSDDLHIFLQT